MPAPKHRALIRRVEHGWTRWPRHRDESGTGPAPRDGMNEFAAQWASAMRIREAENLNRRQAAWS